ncbi:muramoyltetrapeptide carboxypeptidase LdcA involved in peptidoglycan recycling [Jatrophihabitans sp. GAS493]|uniref:S66 family peptidase n=1 Tax=Jatrophihabitans sp. GAS493 TaxID=1907575 RepID=UPI000BB6E110|nr:S66 peptidase family protein [Jatrophihabitans sp. GAS493]SOD70444.1 muramoyltetrapeptide carboxypeptidase LdcA involved in peptidoglycan recycling [Jatrophihabitans sp. GAS493]
MPPVYPAKLRPGDHVRVIAPSRSRALVNEHDHSAVIDARFAELGLRLSYGAHVDERDAFDSSAIDSRVRDLHAAFADPEVNAILTVIGGFNCNELLPYLDWDLIGANPKIFCGYSDITALNNAILARTGLVTYSGPHWSSFGMIEHFDQTLRWFRDALFGSDPILITPAESWTDDLWFLDQHNRELHPNEGWWSLQPGEASGSIVGGNLCTLNLLQGGESLPSLAGALLMLEDDFESNAPTFARDLASLLQLPQAAQVTGLVVGRFQQASAVTRPLLNEIITRQPALRGKPVLGNVDFGHTSPQLTLPIGGQASLRVGTQTELTITRH